MLRMEPFELHHPTTVPEAVELRHTLPNAMYVAGGTDLLPNLKHRLHDVEHLVSLARVAHLGGIEPNEEGGVRIGASSTLHAIATDRALATVAPGLSVAAGAVAGPQHRRMGTIGGNILLDTRCLFYNQSHMWRTSLGFCLKRSGTWCHVIGSAKACVAAQSSDTVPMLVALDAHVTAACPEGRTERVALRELFTKDGRFDQRLTLPQGALLTHVDIPPTGAGHRSTYRKVRARGAVDYPQAGVAVAAIFDEERCTALEIVVGAVMPQPRRITGLETLLGEPLTDERIAHAADRAFRQAKPQPQIHGDPDWRRQLVRIETTRALESLRH